ncbi:glycosyltransferase family 4 protein [Brachybacterium muris]|uniref:glycosyltransferase family 4 protein n=1 Tax=Brachybacterium muris TaxID=219301 RepID=UPI00223B110D|nr:glycosyltransferase family 4 protein [Brachybacterium muris]MCT2176068.1 glycosyltransferase family 4 protein [Brachybacterium muris]
MTTPPTRSRRLCFVVSRAGTAKVFLKNYLLAMSQSGFEVLLISNDDIDLTEMCQLECATWHPVPMSREPSPLSDLRAIMRVRKKLRSFRPDVLVYATPKASMVSAVAGGLAGVPLRVYEQWGLRLETEKGARRLVLWLIEKTIVRLSHQVIANSHSLARVLEEMRLAPSGGVQVLGSGSSHGVDVDHFSRRSELNPLDTSTRAFLDSSHAFTLGYVGRLHNDKGITTLLRAAALCFERGLKVRVLLVGGDEGFVLDSGMIGDLPVHIVGRVEDTRAYYEAMDVLILVSEREGFPNVVLEAASMQVPAIVSDATGARDAVQCGITGKVVATNDVSALAAAIDGFVTGKDDARIYGLRARNWVKTEFSASEVQRLHIDHLVNVLQD